METVTFQNPGLIPIEAITTLGVNIKENDNPIGYFGTGLKYAIAALLRTDQSITIFSGRKGYEFFSRKELVRGTEIDFIYMTSGVTEERLGFTTRLGVNWEPWQIFRELYSNTLDEGGFMEFKKLLPQEGFTTIHVTGADFARAAESKKEVFIEGKPLYSNPMVEIYPNPTTSVFYRGIKAATLKKPSVFTYNILYNTDLTEDRTIKYGYMVDHWINHAIMSCFEETLIEKALCSKTSYENDLRFSDPTEEFAEIVLSIAARRGLLAVNASALTEAERVVRKKSSPEEVQLSPYEQREIQNAKEFLREIGFPIEEEVIVATNLGPGVWGLARDRKIYIDKTVLIKGGNLLIGTILEEHLHISRGFLDESREFQNFLLDLLVSFAKEVRFNRV